MTKLQLSFAMGRNVRTQPLFDGDIPIEGIELLPSNIFASELFWRQLHFEEFDVSEMSISSFSMMKAKGMTSWVGIPVFSTRIFFHTGILVRADSGIEKPEDLRGKRVGIPEYQQTAALWIRGALTHEFGVRPEEMEWYMERNEDKSHGGATGFKPPAGVSFQYIPEEKSIGSMLVSGELDASLLYLSGNNLVDRSRVNVSEHPNIRRLFPDPAKEALRYYQKTGIFPINHCVIVRRALVEKYPWIVLNLYNAFKAAKEKGQTQLKALAEPHFQLGLLPSDMRAELDKDPYPYGMKANRSTLETLTRYSHEQGLTPRIVGLDEIFAESTLQL